MSQNQNQKRSVLVRKPRSGRDFIITGALLVIGAVVGNIIAALRNQDSLAYLADTLPLTLAAVIPVTALVLAVIWRLRSKKDQERNESQ